MTKKPQVPQKSGLMSETMYHISQSIEGALANWKPKEWRWIAEDNRVTVKQAKQYFKDQLAKGHKLIPSVGCDNFDPVEGCKGHEEVKA